MISLADNAIEVALNSWVLELWKGQAKDCNVYMQTLHFCYSLGFLSSQSQSVNETNATQIANFSIASNDTLSFETQVHIPYFIGAAIVFTASLGHMILMMFVNYHQDNDKNKNTSYEDIDVNVGGVPTSMLTKYVIIVIITGGLMITFEGGIELNTFNYLETFLVHTKLHISEQRAAYMNSALNTSFTVSRFIAIFLAMKLKPRTMITINLFVITLGNVLIILFSNSSQTGLWIGILGKSLLLTSLLFN